MLLVFCDMPADLFSKAIKIYCSTKFRRNPFSRSARELNVLMFEHSRHQRNVLSVHNPCNADVKIIPNSFFPVQTIFNIS